MEPADITSQEMLDRLLSEGKITDEEYLRLSKAMQSHPDSPKQVAPENFEDLGSDLPWQVWPTIIVCILASLAVLATIGKNPMLGLIIIGCNMALAYGLFVRNRIAYVLATGVCLMSMMGIFKNPGLIINVVLGIILLTAWRNFFPPEPNPQMRQN